MTGSEARPDLNDLRKRRGYWRKNQVVTAVLLLVWFMVTFVVSYFARSLSFDFFGWPFSFWMGAQGAPVVYVLIVAFYARYMNQLDDRCDVDADSDEG